MPVTVVPLRQLVNDPAAGTYPDTPPDTLFAQDWNMMRSALTTGVKGIYTRGVKVGLEGLEFVASAPVKLAASVQLTFIDGGNSDAQVGYLSNDGELGMQSFFVGLGLRIAAGGTVTHEGLTTHTVPTGDTTNTHELWARGEAVVKDFEVDYRTGTLSVLHILTGDYAVDRDNAGIIFKNPDVRTILRMNDDGELEVADVIDWAARPLTFNNVRKVMLGTDVFVDSITGTDGVVAELVSANPKQYVIRLEGVQAPALDIGLGVDQIGPDTLAAGGLVGDVAAFVTPAEKAAISTLVASVVAIQAELATTVKILRTQDGEDITPDGSGRILLANSSSVIFDKPGDNTARAVASGGGGGGSVISVGAGNGLSNSGSSTAPVLNVNVSPGLLITADSLIPDWGTGTNNVARGDHLHTGVYSPVGHTHSGFVATGGAYADLVAAGKIGAGAGQVAAGTDVRFHTQGTDVGTTSLTFRLRSGFAGTAADADVAGLVIERGAETDARIYFKEDTNLWVAGLVGSEQPIVLDNDARLSDARVPLSHDIDSAHTGQLDSVRVSVSTFSPAQYAALSPNVDGHLAGIDGALGGKLGTSDTRLGGQQFMGAVGNLLLANTYFIGKAGLGELNNATGVINYASIQSEEPLAGGTAITVTIENLNTLVTKTISLTAGDTFFRDPALALAVNAGDEIVAYASIVTGVPNGGVIVVRLSRAS